MKHLAFLIGIQDYGHIQKLRTPLNDIRDLGQVLETKYGYATHACENPSHSGLKSFLKDMEAKVKGTDNPEETFVLLYFAGHGIAQDSETGIRGYLVPADARRNDKATWLPMDELLIVVERLPCRHTLIMLDCCFSGSLRWASKHRDISGLGEQDKLYRQHYRHFLNRCSCQVVTSAAPDQLALDFTQRGTETEHSPFAECVIRGLQGEADTVPDKVITCAELFAYLQNQLVVVSSQHDNPQNASLFPLDKHDFGEYLFFMDGFHPDQLEEVEYHNPYRGLSAYEAENRGDFFGRSQAITALLSEVEQHPLTVVLGASGSGKSSLVKAGIVPRLKGRINIIKPGLTPLAELPDPNSYDILVIDQLEQLITQATEQDAKAFLERMLGLLASGKKIIATLRIDYESQLLKILEMESYWHRYLVPLFSAEELREVIVTPTFRQGRFIVPMTLVDSIIEEVIPYPGSLPLLSFTMRQLFERCKDTPYRNIETKDYKALGGVIGALQRKADAVHDALPDEAHRNTMRCLMLRMVSLTGGQVAGRRVLLDDLHFADSTENERLKTVQTRLEDERLIVADKDHSGKKFIEPVHDALVNTWDKVQGWVKSFGDVNLLLHNELETAVSKYRREGMTVPFLWHNNSSLEQIINIQELKFKIELNKNERDFIEASSNEKERLKTKNRRVVGGITTFIVTLGVLAIFFGVAQRKLRIQSDKKAYANQLASNAIRDYKQNPNIYLDSLIKAYSITHDRNIMDLLCQEIPHSIFYVKEINIDEKPVIFADVDSRIKWLIILYADSTLQLLDIRDTPKKILESKNTVEAEFGVDDTNEIYYRKESKTFLFNIETKKEVVCNHVFLPKKNNLRTQVVDTYSRELKLIDDKDSLIALLKEHEDVINDVCVSRNSSFIVTCSDDQSSIIWNSKGDILFTLKASNKERVMKCFLSKNEKKLISVHGAYNTKLFIWNIKGVPLFSIPFTPKDKENLIDVYYSNYINKNLFVNVRAKNENDSEAVLARFNLLKNEEVILDSLNWWPYADNPISIGRKTKTFVYPTRQYGFAVRDFLGNLIFEHHDSQDTIQAVFLNPQENVIVATDYFNNLITFDSSGCRTAEVDLKFLTDSFSLNWHTLKFFPNGKQFVIGGGGGIYFFSQIGLYYKKIDLGEEIRTLDISKDGSKIICGGENLILIDSSGNVLDKVASPHPTMVTKVRFSPNKRVYISLGVYGSLKLWDFDGRLLYEFKEMPIAWNATFSGDSIIIAGRNEIKVWSMPNLPEDFVNIK